MPNESYTENPGRAIPQPVDRGRCYVDLAANPDEFEFKVTVWVPKGGREMPEVWTGDEVEVRSLSRVMRYRWEPEP